MSDSLPRTSVALCTYQGAAYLPQLLDSLARQTVRPAELIVCDDGSEDASVELVRAFAASATFPVDITVNERNLGPAANFDQAVRRSQGDIVLLCDQDDVWHPDKIDKFGVLFGSRPELGWAFSDGAMIDAGGRPIGVTLWQAMGFWPARQARFRRGHALEEILRRNMVTGCALGFRRALAAYALPFSQHVIHDRWIVQVFAALGIPGDLLSEPLLDYRVHPDQKIGSPSSSPVVRFLDRRSRTDPWLIENVGATRDLLERLEREDVVEHGTRGDSRAVVGHRLEHVLTRQRLRSLPLPARLPVILRELLTGRYDRFSHWNLAAVVDLMAHRNGTGPKHDDRG